MILQFLEKGESTHLQLYYLNVQYYYYTDFIYSINRTYKVQHHCTNSPIHKAAVRPAAVQNMVWRAFQLPAPFTAYGDFRNCTRQNHETAGNREAGGFVNSAVNNFQLNEVSFL